MKPVKRTRKVMFTGEQMMLAKHHPKLAQKFKTHRDYVEWLFMTQHKCKVENHALLRYKYMIVGTTNVTEVEGDLGKAIVFA